jgi:hypothetical protein
MQQAPGGGPAPGSDLWQLRGLGTGLASAARVTGSGQLPVASIGVSGETGPASGLPTRTCPTQPDPEIPDARASGFIFPIPAKSGFPISRIRDEFRPNRDARWLSHSARPSRRLGVRLSQTHRMRGCQWLRAWFSGPARPGPYSGPLSSASEGPPPAGPLSAGGPPGGAT